MATRPPRLSTAAMTRSGPIASGESAGEVEVHGAVAKQRRADDHGVGAVPEHCLRALDAPDAAADPTGKPGADRGDDRRVVALALRGIEVDQLDAWEALELPDPRLRIGRLDRQLLPLDELDDMTALNRRARIRTGIEAWVEQQLIKTDRNARVVQIALHVGDAGIRVVKDRRRQRSVRMAGREDVGEVLEAAGAARRNHGNVHGVGHRGGQLAVEACARAVAVHRRQQDLAGAARFGLARPLHRVARRVGGPASDEDAKAARDVAAGGPSIRFASMATMTAWLP